MSDFNLGSMSRNELVKLRKDVDKAIENYEVLNKQEAFAAAEAAAREAGYSLAELMGAMSGFSAPAGQGSLPSASGGLHSPTIPTVDDSKVFSAWYRREDPSGDNSGPRMTPGGFKPFEHRWALPEAFELHERTQPLPLGKRRRRAGAYS